MYRQRRASERLEHDESRIAYVRAPRVCVSRVCSVCMCACVCDCVCVCARACVCVCANISVLMLFPTSVSSLSNGLNVRVHAIPSHGYAGGQEAINRSSQFVSRVKERLSGAMPCAMLCSMRCAAAGRSPQRHSPERRAAPPRVKTGTVTTQQQIGVKTGTPRKARANLPHLAASRPSGRGGPRSGKTRGSQSSRAAAA